ncbi:MAG: hypothetical protein PHD68_09610 [Rugosibacter sp.]|nr:hypothetical protein [Rugosibacter sp.]
MAKKSPTLDLELYYSDVVVEKLGSWSAKGSPATYRKIAEQQAVILGLALPQETTNSLVVERVAMPMCEFVSYETQHSYQVQLSEQLTHIVSVCVGSDDTPPIKAKLVHLGILPAPSLGYDPLNNSWLYASVMEPVLSRRYTLDGRSCTLREQLIRLSACSDAQLKTELDDGPDSKRYYMWLQNKGAMIWGVTNSLPSTAIGPALQVRWFPGLTDWNNMLAVLEAKYGPGALDMLKDYAGTAAHYAPNGNLVLDFWLHRTT